MTSEGSTQRGASGPEGKRSPEARLQSWVKEIKDGFSEGRTMGFYGSRHENEEGHLSSVSIDKGSYRGGVDNSQARNIDREFARGEKSGKGESLEEGKIRLLGREALEMIEIRGEEEKQNSPFNGKTILQFAVAARGRGESYVYLVVPKGAADEAEDLFSQKISEAQKWRFLQDIFEESQAPVEPVVPPATKLWRDEQENGETILPPWLRNLDAPSEGGGGDEPPGPHVSGVESSDGEESEDEKRARMDNEASVASADRLGALGDIWRQVNGLDGLAEEGFLDRDDLKAVVRNFSSQKALIDKGRDSIPDEDRALWDYARRRVEERIAALAGKLPKAQIGENDATATAAAIQALATAQARTADIQEKSFELSMRSYNDFIDQERQRAPIHALNMLAERPGWYREIHPNTEINDLLQRQIDFRARLSYSARTKQEHGSIKLEASTHPELAEWNTDVWDDMWLNMPGHRVALVTMMRENFRLDPNDLGHVQLTEQGENNYKDHLRYHRQLVDRVKTYLLQHPQEMERNRFNLKANSLEEYAQLLATAAVSSAKNMVFVGGLLESGDLRREIKPKEVNSEQLRAFMHPQKKALAKSGAEDASDPYTAEEWGGAWGNWYVQGVQYVEGFTDLYRNEGGPQYFPRRLFVSLFEDVRFSDKPDVPVSSRNKSFAEVVFSQRVVNTGESGLIDLSDPGACRPIHLKYSEQWGALHGDMMDSATKVFAVITGKAGQDFTPNQLANALAKLRGNESIKSVYQSDDLVLACIVGMAGGPEPGSYFDGGRTILLHKKQANMDYDVLANELTAEPRLFADGGQRERILKRLLAEDFSRTSALALFRSALSDMGRFGSERGRVEAAAQTIENRMRRNQRSKFEQTKNKNRI